MPSFTKSPTRRAMGYDFNMYESRDTGLRGLLMHTGEPLANLHIAVATEAETNEYAHAHDGLPHTLEHLVFLGSEKHPFKGILDKLANRSLGDGTNAWTATDHTVYTLCTAGHEGALNLLPIYADHVLYPTLEDAGFVTEIHHVNGKGENKGVVYCEMQGRENDEGSLVDNALRGLLYPASGYSSETGGKMANLRALSNEQIRRYHREYYTPRGTLFIMSGTASEEEFLAALEQVEERVRSKPPPEERPRPWGRAVPPMDHAAHGVLLPTPGGSTGWPLEVMFPSEDESVGTVSVGWRGPAYGDRTAWCRVWMMWEYLVEGADAPLQKAFVETEEPLCGAIDAANEVFSQGYHQLWLTECDVETIDQVVPRLLVEVEQAAQAFDLKRMRRVIRRYRRQTLEHAERAPTEALLDGVVRNFLYGPRAGDGAVDAVAEMDALQADTDELPLLAAAEALGADEWKETIYEWILRRPMGAVIGKPSAALAESNQAEDAAREAQQAVDLGTDGLAKRQKTFDDAVAYNEREVATEHLTAVPVPSLDKVRQVPLLTIRGACLPERLAIAEGSGASVDEARRSSVLASLRAHSAGGEAAPFWADWSLIDSAFVTASVGLSTSSLSWEQRLMLPLLIETAFKLPATLDDGTHLSKDEFISRLHEDTVSASFDVGLDSGTIPQFVTLAITTELDGGEGLAHGLTWLRRTLHLTEVSAGALRIGAQKLAAKIPTDIRSASTVMSAVNLELEYDPERANKIALSPLRQHAFLADLLSNLEDPEKAAAIVDSMVAMRKSLAVPSKMQVFVAGQLDKLGGNPMQQLAAALTPPAVAPDASAVCAVALEAELPPTGHLDDHTACSVRSRTEATAIVSSLSATESSYMLAMAPGVGACDNDTAPLLVAMEYLTALEGDFWVKLRGAGLTYGSSLANSVDLKRVSFSLYRCADLPAAYEAARDIVVGYASGEATISSVGLEAAKSSLAYSVVRSVSTRIDAATVAWVGQYMGKRADHSQWILSEMARVTQEDALCAIRRYIVPLFDPLANVSIACPANKVESICAALAKRGIDARHVPEDKLTSAFGGARAAQPSSTAAAKVPGRTVSSKLRPGAFASMFKCGCPRCDKPSRRGR